MHRCFAAIILTGWVFITPAAFAHINDEAFEAHATMTIREDAVQTVVAVPVRYAFPMLLEGADPIEMDKLDPDEMVRRVQPFLAERNPVMIDGVAVRPTILSAEINMTNARLPARLFTDKMVMRFGELIYLARYETKRPPRRVELTWDIFVPRYGDSGEPAQPNETMPVTVILNVGDKQKLTVFTQEEPAYTWHSEEAAAVPDDLLLARPMEKPAYFVPLLSILLAGVSGVVALCLRSATPRVRWAVVVGGVAVGLLALPIGRMQFSGAPAYAELNDDQAIELFRSLHANIYRAFDYTDEGAIYDALAQSIDGPMLETIYNDVYQALILRDEGGAVCKVQRVDVTTAEVYEPPDADADADADADDLEPGAYRVRAAWTVDGLVQHHGHTHARTNAFEAVYTLAPRGGAWRIVDAEILDQQRVDDGKQQL